MDFNSSNCKLENFSTISYNLKFQAATLEPGDHVQFKQTILWIQKITAIREKLTVVFKVILKCTERLQIKHFIIMLLFYITITKS